MVLCQQQKGTEAPATYFLTATRETGCDPCGFVLEGSHGLLSYFAEPSFYCIGGSVSAALVVTEVREQAQ
jgi:hypothetical protein